MESLIGLLNVLLPLGYLLVVLAALGVFLDAPAWVRRWATPLTLGVAAFHAVYLLLVTLSYEHVPVANVWEGFTFIAFGMVLVQLALEWHAGERGTGIFLLTPVLLFQILSSAFIEHSQDVDPMLRSPLFGVHVTTALLGYVAFAVAAVYGTMYMLLYRELKKHRIGLIFQRLPTLETISRMNLGGVVLGWVALTVAILAGTAWAAVLSSSGELPGNLLLDPKFLLTVLLWVVYGLCLVGRYLLRLSNRQLAYVSVGAFALMVASSLVVTFFLSTFHRFS